MAYFKLTLLYEDKTVEGIVVKRFSDLSRTKSKFLYYEKPYDLPGKGTCVERDKVACFECNPL